MTEECGSIASVSKQNGMTARGTVDFLSSIEDIIDEARNARMFILVDDEDRENEGDLVIPAQMATPDVINFMAMYGRGLICLALSQKRCDHLGLKLMSQANESRHSTAFTVSIEARDGVTTGISAPDRARTIAAAIDPAGKSSDIVSPGHIFPLMARDGGVLVRAGHTEASVDIARLAGLNPSGVICEIMNEDGTMARRPDLIKFAQVHGLKIGAIADLIAYRRRHDRTIEKIADTNLRSRFGGEFKMYVYANRVEYAEHVALVMGDVGHGGPVMVRMHALNILDDALGSLDRGKEGDLQRSMELIGAEGRGVIVLIREPRRTYLADLVKAHSLGQPPDRSAQRRELRDYGVGAQILLDLGVSEMTLLSDNIKTIVGIEGYGLKVVEQRSIR
ncbi:MAG: Riboflavin biosynthesis protein RibBA [Alphaproteobacteria bacterium MarineAlpha4_Bin2]|nr:MAG: Riboflavin biosynthesis protein RibBA [Alphaproteobacteria bacterium MarineAlpha4_Bin2]